MCLKQFVLNCMYGYPANPLPSGIQWIRDETFRMKGVSCVIVDAPTLVFVGDVHVIVIIVQVKLLVIACMMFGSRASVDREIRWRWRRWRREAYGIHIHGRRSTIDELNVNATWKNILHSSCHVEYHTATLVALLLVASLSTSQLPNPNQNTGDIVNVNTIVDRRN